MTASDLTLQEKYHALDTIHDSSLQNEENPLWWICFDLEEQKWLMDWNKRLCDLSNQYPDIHTNETLQKVLM